MNNEHTMKPTTEAAPPTEPFPGRAVQKVALEHALRLARSAHIELSVALAIQCAWMDCGHTPEHVHALLAIPRPELARQLLVAVKQQDSNASEHRAWKALARKAVALDAEYKSRVVSLQSPYYVSCWTSATGRLANEVLGSLDSDEYWQLVADTAKDIKDCYFLHFS